MSVENRLRGTPLSRFGQELFGNSAHFPIANILLEMLIEGPAAYLRAPDLYVMLVAGLIQAYWLSRWQATPRPRRFLGNLLGPLVYTVVEALVEGPSFFLLPNHWAYWGFGLALGLLQAVRPRLSGLAHGVAVVAESLTRTGILFIMYALFEVRLYPGQNPTLAVFLADPSHRFFGFAVLLLGLSIGLSDLTAQRYLNWLRETSLQLNTYSEWLLGRELLQQIIANPQALGLKRQERAVLFMDIRGFTRWSESRPPEEVVAMLNQYYRIAEAALVRHNVIKFKFAADEVMAVFHRSADGARAAQALQADLRDPFAPYGLGAGAGLHAGPLVEGLLGSRGVRFYDVIGDTVNTAKRLEGAAAAGEVVVSDPVRRELGDGFSFGPGRPVQVKGKTDALLIYPVLTG